MSKHVEVHGREERDVGQHDPQNEEWKAEGDIEHIRQLDRQNILLHSLQKSSIHANEFTRHSNRIGNDEKCVSVSDILNNVINVNIKNLSHVKKKGGFPTRLTAYMEYLMISVMVQAKRRSGNPMESWEVGHMYRIAQTTYTLELEFLLKSIFHGMCT